jgi:tRNA (uracil-5-)-methyltransferase
MIYSNEMSGGYKEDDRCELLSGDSIYYTEDLLGFKFTVSPFAFFQVNTNVFEKMLNEIGHFLNIDKETIVFDICCGTGAIGICLSKFAKKVVGVELVEAAVVNARENVLLNKELIEPDKCEFHAGRAEYLLPDIAKSFSDSTSRIVGIVDPPRSGLHRDVLKALRTCKGLDRLVYVSCNPVSQMRDMEFLCYSTEKKRKAPAFKPIKCIGADLFPDTNHVESIIFFEREPF